MLFLTYLDFNTNHVLYDVLLQTPGAGNYTPSGMKSGNGTHKETTEKMKGIYNWRL